jgi:hypothetical protein
MQLPMRISMLNGARSKHLYDELSFAILSTDGAVLR